MAPARSIVTKLEQIEARLQDVVRELDADRIDGDTALGVLQAAARITKLGAAVHTVVSRRIDECGVHRRSGHLTSAHLVAATTGSSLATAIDTLATSHRLGDQPEVERTLRAGRLSLEQATVISAAVEHDPHAEHRLLDVSSRETLRTLRDRARAVTSAADTDRDNRYERQRAAMSFRHGVDDAGMTWGHFRLPPDLGATVIGRIETQTDRVHRQAARQGRRDGHDRYAAEALVDLLAGDARPAGAAPARAGCEVVVLVDLPALRRGTVGTEETCTIPGFGDVPIAVPRRLLEGDALLTGVLRDGNNVLAVRRFGRHIPRAVRTALTVGRVLRDGALVCTHPGCDRRTPLEWDHITPIADGGRTDTTSLQPLCPAHLRAKSIGDAAARRSGPAP